MVCVGRREEGIVPLSRRTAHPWLGSPRTGSQEQSLREGAEIALAQVALLEIFPHFLILKIISLPLATSLLALFFFLTCRSNWQHGVYLFVSSGSPPGGGDLLVAFSACFLLEQYLTASVLPGYWKKNEEQKGTMFFLPGNRRGARRKWEWWGQEHKGPCEFLSVNQGNVMRAMLVLLSGRGSKNSLNVNSQVQGQRRSKDQNQRWLEIKTSENSSMGAAGLSGFWGNSRRISQGSGSGWHLDGWRVCEDGACLACWEDSEQHWSECRKKGTFSAESTCC